jgi:D-alanine-D-alanine ligase
MPIPSVLVLGGGPDSEREVSIKSAHFISEALRASKRFAGVQNQTIEKLTPAQLKALPGDVIFPALHGGWGEGGPLQDLLDADGRPFVGCKAAAARHAMDKLATKFTAVKLGIPTPDCRVLDLRDAGCPLSLPVIIKPVHEGSTVGLYVCRTEKDWERSCAGIREEREGTRRGASGHPGMDRVYMIEACVSRPGGLKARELTVGLIDGEPLPVIEITPADGLYDYEAKYTRTDTNYLVEPRLPGKVTQIIQAQTAALAKAMGVRHLARADFMLDGDGDGAVAWFLEINTLPGFTDHSLVPMAARHAGMEMPVLCARLVDMAIRDHAAEPKPA